MEAGRHAGLRSTGEIGMAAAVAAEGPTQPCEHTTSQHCPEESRAEKIGPEGCEAETKGRETDALEVGWRGARDRLTRSAQCLAATQRRKVPSLGMQAGSFGGAIVIHVPNGPAINHLIGKKGASIAAIQAETPHALRAKGRGGSTRCAGEGHHHHRADAAALRSLRAFGPSQSGRVLEQFPRPRLPLPIRRGHTWCHQRSTESSAGARPAAVQQRQRHLRASTHGARRSTRASHGMCSTFPMAVR